MTIRPLVQTYCLTKWSSQKQRTLTTCIFTLNSLQGAKKSKDDSWKFEPNQKVRVKIHRKEYKKRDFRTKAEETHRPSQFERVICKLIEDGAWNIENSSFYGDMQIGENSATASILSGQDVFGNVLPSDQIKRNIDRIFGVQSKLKGEKKHFTDEELKDATASASSGSKMFSGGGI